MGGGAGRGRAAAAALARGARPRRRGRLRRQPERPQPLDSPLRPRAPEGARDQEHLLGQHGRPDAEAGRGRVHVRHDPLGPGSRRGPDRPPRHPRRQPARVERQPPHGARHARTPAPDPRARREGRGRRSAPQPHRRARRRALLPNHGREPAGLQRQHHDRAGDPLAHPGDPRARRPRRADRPAPHRDGRGRRRAPLHPARHGRAAPLRARARPVRRGTHGRGLPRRAPERAGRGARAYAGLRARAGQRRLRDRGRGHPPDGARAGRRAERRRLRPDRHLHAGVRHAGQLAGGRVERAHREPGSPRRRDVPPRRRRAVEFAGHARPRSRRDFRPLEQQGARLAGGLRRAARLLPRGGNRHAGRRPGPRPDHDRWQPHREHPERRPPHAGGREPRLHAVDRRLPERDDAPRGRHPARPLAAPAPALRRRALPARRAQRGQLLAPGDRARSGDAAGVGDAPAPHRDRHRPGNGRRRGGARRSGGRRARPARGGPGGRRAGRPRSRRGAGRARRPPRPGAPARPDAPRRAIRRRVRRAARGADPRGAGGRTARRRSRPARAADPRGAAHRERSHRVGAGADRRRRRSPAGGGRPRGERHGPDRSPAAPIEQLMDAQPRAPGAWQGALHRAREPGRRSPPRVGRRRPRARQLTGGHARGPRRGDRCRHARRGQHPARVGSRRRRHPDGGCRGARGLELEPARRRDDGRSPVRERRPQRHPRGARSGG